MVGSHAGLVMVVIVAAWSATACNGSSKGGSGSNVAHVDTVALRWNDAQLHAIRTVKPGSPQVARQLALVSTAMYGAWAVYDPDARCTLTDLDGARHVVAAGSLLAEDAPANDIALHWATFSDAADEAGISRRYGGIHFRSGDLSGRVLGRAVGEACFDTAQALWRGDSGPLWGPFGDS